MNERYHDQDGASAFLEATYGIRRAPRTLQKARCTGINSPPFIKIAGSRVLYAESALQKWAEAQLSPMVSSTSELPAKPQVGERTVQSPSRSTLPKPRSDAA